MYQKFRNWLHNYGKHYWDIALLDVKFGARRQCKICGKKQRMTTHGKIEDGLIYWIDDES